MRATINFSVEPRALTHLLKSMPIKIGVKFLLVEARIEVPERFVRDQIENAEGDEAQGLTPIPFAAHSAIKSLVEGLPFGGSVRVNVVTIDGEGTADY